MDTFPWPRFLVTGSSEAAALITQRSILRLILILKPRSLSVFMCQTTAALPTQLRSLSDVLVSLRPPQGLSLDIDPIPGLCPSLHQPCLFPVTVAPLLSCFQNLPLSGYLVPVCFMGLIPPSGVNMDQSKSTIAFGKGMIAPLPVSLLVSEEGSSPFFQKETQDCVNKLHAWYVTADTHC